ncbi:lactate dehydrogenase [Cnuibacter physcomitrellae]|uniref:Ldh family oxidoreductase n=1 Tax=Cnuibacter physcomitrellae TaxID=1619308 RepID=UPI0012F4D33D|nr:Ldh family oxidoreductase [Cnuibacter physcomitrellae]GGI38938.1 lactate dehydrogenase [Cnuibacter physcomitrellae]
MRLDAAQVIVAVRSLLEAQGVPSGDAELIADSLVAADLWGHQSHGVLRLPWYIDRLRAGSMTARTEPAIVSDTGPLLVMDGRDGIGQVLAERARTEAVRRAHEFGVAAVGVRNSNHFGTAMYFTRRAAAEGCVGILTTNASPAMAPWGGREKAVGTNPWSVAAPFGDRVVVVDVANTAVARGKIHLAKQRGDSIPETWALGRDGNPTSDPAEAVDGVILPMAGHKGYAIAFMMDVLSGALTGSEVGTGVHGPYEPTARSGAGHLFLAIDVSAAGSMAEYTERVGRIVSEVTSVPPAEGHARVLYPGEVEDRHRQAALEAGGLDLPQRTIDALRRIAHEDGVVLPF